MLEGRNVNLRLMEKDDVDFMVQLRNDIGSNAYVSVKQISKTEAMKEFDNPTPLALITERTCFIIEKKDGTKIFTWCTGSFSPQGTWKSGILCLLAKGGKATALKPFK
ncbi:MAG: hypothetical protein ABSD73_01855 [Candidatus Bathyarchaeia archaeon]